MAKDGHSMPLMMRTGGLQMKNVTLQLTDEEYWLVIQHKSLLQCNTWQDYLERLKSFPRRRRDLIYDLRDEATRIITMRMNKTLFGEINVLRKRFFKSWREFVLESAYEDGTVEAYNTFCAKSLIMLNEGERPIE